MKVEASSSGEDELSLPEGNPGDLKELDPGEREAILVAVPSWQFGRKQIFFSLTSGPDAPSPENSE
jgi:hypothetical protein